MATKMKTQARLFCDESVDPNDNIHRFVKAQKELLELELQSQEEELKEATFSESPKKGSANKEGEERASYALHKLQVADVSIGLYGRTVVTLESGAPSTTANEGGEQEKKTETLLPAHKFTVGDDVEVRGPPNSDCETDNSKIGKHGASVRGVVCQVTNGSILIALSEKQGNKSRPQKASSSDKKQGTTNSNSTGSVNDNNDDDDNLPFDTSSSTISVLATSSVEVHRKMMRSLEELQKDGTSHKTSSCIIQAMFSRKTIMDSETSKKSSSTTNQPFNPNLDASQVSKLLLPTIDVTPDHHIP
jgi:hypothetical protein